MKEWAGSVIDQILLTVLTVGPYGARRQPVLAVDPPSLDAVDRRRHPAGAKPINVAGF